MEAYNKSMQKQEIREVVKLRMIGDSIFGERKGNQDARDRSLMFGMEGKMDGHLLHNFKVYI